MIEMKIDGEVYTKKQYEKDYVRMMDSLREECIGERDCSSVDCEDCPLYKETCHTHKEENFDYRCLDTVEIVHDWAKAHPVKTNRDKLEEVFGVKVVKCFITNGKEKTRAYKFSNEENKIIKLFSLSLEDTSFSEWLDDEYKEPKEESEE